MKNKKSTRGQKSVFVGDKPSPQKYYPTPGEQIADKTSRWWLCHRRFYRAWILVEYKSSYRQG